MIHIYTHFSLISCHFSCNLACNLLYGHYKAILVFFLFFYFVLFCLGYFFNDLTAKSCWKLCVKPRKFFFKERQFILNRHTKISQIHNFFLFFCFFHSPLLWIFLMPPTFINKKDKPIYSQKKKKISPFLKKIVGLQLRGQDCIGRWVGRNIWIFL